MYVFAFQINEFCIYQSIISVSCKHRGLLLQLKSGYTIFLPAVTGNETDYFTTILVFCIFKQIKKKREAKCKKMPFLITRDHDYNEIKQKLVIMSRFRERFQNFEFVVD